MSTYLAERIHKPTYFRLAPSLRGRGNRETYSIGFDSEAETVEKRQRGKPFLYQFAHPDGHADLVEVPLGKHEGLYTFFEYVRSHCTRKDVEYVIWGFNLQYEYTQLFGDQADEIKTAPEFHIKLRLRDDGTAVFIRALNEKRFTFTIEFGKMGRTGPEFIPTTKRRVKVVDAMAFFPMSLKEAAKVIGVGDKHERPETFTRKLLHDPTFREYAAQDALLHQRLGEYIIALHKEYDVPLCVSAPHFAARTFKRKYLKAEVELPHPDLEQYGLTSYHGGKNGFYLDKPTLLPRVWHYDIRSAYPEAMRALPDIETADFVFSEKYVPGAHAVWSIIGEYRPCRYKAFVSDAPRGRVSLTITSYELDAAIDCGEIDLISCEGYMLVGRVGEGPLVRYVDDFYALKRDAKDTATRATAKLFLNSLYGKFFQKVPIGRVGAVDMTTGAYIDTAPDQPYDFEAGGLYHPPIASLITGFVRGKIHRLEHRYRSIMTSTDGFFAYDAPKGKVLGEGLGDLTAEIGELRIWRERLYVFTPSNKADKPTYALHGFRGTRAQLLRMPLTAGNIYRYMHEQMVTLRMSVRSFGGRRYRAGEFAELQYSVVLPAAEDTS